jgi:enoyl-CoA hydratase/carnithine racemase
VTADSHTCGPLPTPSLDRVDEVYVLDLGTGLNRINPELLDGISAALDEVVASPAPRGLVTTASGEFFSTGLDLEWMAAHPDGIGDLVNGMHELFARILELPLPTVAAVQHHVFAGGALLALTHDYRVMREDRGYFGLPEVDFGIAFTQGASDLVRSRLAPQVAHEALTTGRRYTGAEAAEARIVDELAGESEVVPRAVALVKEIGGKDPATYGAIKATLYRETLASLRDASARAGDAERFSAALAATKAAASG